MIQFLSPPPELRSLPGNIPNLPPPPQESTSKSSMGSVLTFLKTILIPLLISLALYLVLTYALLPLYRRHYARYSHYLLQNLSTHTSSMRERLSQALMSILLPSSWRRQQQVVDGGRGADSDDGLFDEEEGEGMVGFAMDEGRRQQLERRAAVEPGDDERRLSRDLEEGFRDDSDEDQEHGRIAVSAGR
ncbi:MAG: hypothetical protein M1830_004980 [Pleopsidium flavum]|nr:MAG: hypothetical protein M1830_004980 [Pleopsidium flavum]